jgi:hypothetical protein
MQHETHNDEKQNPQLRTYLMLLLWVLLNPMRRKKGWKRESILARNKDSLIQFELPLEKNDKRSFITVLKIFHSSSSASFPVLVME